MMEPRINRLVVQAMLIGVIIALLAGILAITNGADIAQAFITGSLASLAA